MKIMIVGGKKLKVHCCTMEKIRAYSGLMNALVVLMENIRIWEVCQIFLELELALMKLQILSSILLLMESVSSRCHG